MGEEEGAREKKAVMCLSKPEICSPTSLAAVQVKKKEGRVAVVVVNFIVDLQD